MLHITYPLLKVEVLNAGRVEGGGAANDTVDFIALFYKKFGEEGAILARYPSDECNLIRVSNIC